MTAPALPDSVADIQALVAGARRRARWALFLRYVCVAGAGALLAGEAIFAATGLWDGAPVLTGVVLAGAALIGAGVTAILRTPDTRETAAVLDARLHLEDRVVTAVQCAGGTDAFSVLVTRDATTRLAGCNTAVAFPVTAPRATMVVLGLAAAAPLVFVLAGTGLPRFRPVQTGNSFPGGQTATGPGDSQDGVQQRGADETRPGASMAGPTAESAATAPPPPDADRDGPSPLAATDPAPQGSASPRAAAADSSGARPELRPDPGGGQPDRAVSGDRPGDAARAGTGGAGAGAGESHLAGGVSRQSPVAGRQGPRARPAGADYEAAYRVARARSETAIAQEHVPPDRREHVRRYFIEIRPREQP